MKEIVIRIDGQDVRASVGKTILEVAKEKGIFILILPVLWEGEVPF